MKFSQALKMAMVALKGNKMRSFLTMLGIIIGVLAVTLLISVVQGATGEITGQIEGLGSNLLQVSMMSPTDTYLTTEDMRELEKSEFIQGATGIVSKGADVKGGNETESYTVEGVENRYQNITGQVISLGHFISDIDVAEHTYNAVVGTNVANDLFGIEDCIGNEIDIMGYNFTIVGVLEESDTMLANKDDTVIIPLITAQRLFDDKEFSTLYVSATTKENVDIAEEITDDFLIKELGDDEGYRIINQNMIIDVMNEVMSIMTILLSGIAAISLLVGGIGIMNIMLVSVTERTREIGVRKAIGAQKSDILTQFLIEAVVLSVFGGLIGIGLSYIGLEVIGLAMGISMSMSISTIALSVGFSAFIGVVFGIYPANKAANLRPIDALRYE
jgi:putative ABC transport system permease protein